MEIIASWIKLRTSPTRSIFMNPSVGVTKEVFGWMVKLLRYIYIYYFY